MTGRARTVLLADADPGTVSAVRAALAGEGRTVLAAADAREALSTLGGQRVDVLVSELSLAEN